MRIIFFTSSFPFGPATIWKANEIDSFIKGGAEVIVVPFEYVHTTHKVEYIPGVSYEEPLFRSPVKYSLKYKLFKILFSANARYFIREFRNDKVYLRKSTLVKWITDSFLSLNLVNHPAIKKLKAISDEKTIWYFFWGRESSLIIPFLSSRKFKVACRFHGYDLYKIRNDGYIPFQKQQVINADLLLPCSVHGFRYLQSEFEVEHNKMFVARLGSVIGGMSRPSDDNILRIVTCSNAIPVKRLHIIVEALGFMVSDVIWTHFGDGILLSDLRNRVSSLNKTNVAIRFMGRIPTAGILKYYHENSCDIFINVSESEGVPVSIMEALSAGIPVYATNVGGTSEIVDSTVGKLLPSDINGTLLCEYLEQFILLPGELKAILRNNARKRSEADWNANKNATVLLERLNKLL